MRHDIDLTPESLILVWLATRKATPKTDDGLLASDISRSLGAVLSPTSKSTPDALGNHLESLAKHRLVEKLAPPDKRCRPRWRIAGAGRTHALQLLGISALPVRQRVDWAWAKRMLVLRALGPLPPSALDHAGETPWLAAWLLAKHHGLPRSSDMTPSSVLAQLAARVAGSFRPDRFNLSDAFSWAVSHGAGGPPAPFDLAAFARHVNDAARGAPSGRWFDDRVFIAHVWKETERRGHCPGMSLSEFQTHLLEAHKARLVRLVRGDLIAALPRDDVRASETQDGDRTFHFVSVDGARPEGALR